MIPASFLLWPCRIFSPWVRPKLDYFILFIELIINYNKTKTKHWFSESRTHRIEWNKRKELASPSLDCKLMTSVLLSYSLTWKRSSCRIFICAMERPSWQGNNTDFRPTPRKKPNPVSICLNLEEGSLPTICSDETIAPAYTMTAAFWETLKQRTWISRIQIPYRNWEIMNGCS